MSDLEDSHQFDTIYTPVDFQLPDTNYEAGDNVEVTVGIKGSPNLIEDFQTVLSKTVVAAIVKTNTFDDADTLFHPSRIEGTFGHAPGKKKLWSRINFTIDKKAVVDGADTSYDLVVYNAANRDGTVIRKSFTVKLPS